MKSALFVSVPPEILNPLAAPAVVAAKLKVTVPPEITISPSPSDPERSSVPPRVIVPVLFTSKFPFEIVVFPVGEYTPLPVTLIFPVPTVIAPLPV